MAISASEPRKNLPSASRRTVVDLWDGRARFGRRLVGDECRARIRHVRCRRCDTELGIRPSGRATDLRTVDAERHQPDAGSRKWTKNELDARRRSRFGKPLGQLPRGGSGHDDPKAHSDAGFDISAPTACSSNTSPRSTSCSARLTRAMASGSLSSSRVASMDSRSEDARRTTYSRPFRVTWTRSCVRATSSAISESRALTSESGNVVIDPEIVVCARGPCRLPINENRTLG